MVQVRKAVLEDVPAIARVQVDTWRTAYAGIIADDYLANLSYDLSEQQWRPPLTNPQSRATIFVAEDEMSRIVGFAACGPERENTPGYSGELYAIYVLQETQRRGAGRKLVGAVARRLLECEHSSMLLWVLAENQPSRRFYEALGGVVLEEKTFVIGQQTLVEVSYGYQDLAPLAALAEMNQ